MHKTNVKGIVFTGENGKIAINQILKAKPVRNKYTTTVKSRSEQFIKNFNRFEEFLQK